MKQLTTYKCDKCGATYDNQEDCVKCESSHVMPKKMVSLSYNYGFEIKDEVFRTSLQNNLDSTYPQMIKILMEDGETIEYKPVHIKKKSDKMFEDSMKKFDNVFKNLLNKQR